MKPAPRESRWRSFRRWPLALGATGFACGYLGPIELSPDANQGPLLGILITGPGGALLGVALGAVATWLPLSQAVRRGALLLACVAVALVTLYWSTPDPAFRGEIIDGAVRGCQAPAALAETTVDDWQDRVAKTPWSQPRPNWKSEVSQKLRSDRGLVLDLEVTRVRRVYQNRKPWNRDVFAEPWDEKGGEVKHYYAAGGSGSCGDYLRTGSAAYFPRGGTATSWPPVEIPNLLGLQTLAPVPREYERFASP
ncbi:MAG TPA: hypothetical protein VMS55_08600 [Myxococcota bacterium]|nr:hypothetical protein [Myxococcota bacterium]